MNYIIIIVFLIIIIYYLFNELNSQNNDIIYLFVDTNNILSKEIEKEWCKVEEYLCEKKIKNKKIYLDDPVYTEWKNNFNIKSVPEIIKVRCDGFRIKYNGKRISKNIIAWIFNNNKFNG